MLLPADFAQRGVAVPFTTRLLFFARMRLGPSGGIEYLVPGLAGGLKTCVIPKGKIGETLSMSVFDRALMDELSDLSSVTPAAVEQASLAIGITGLGGSRLMRQARQRQQADRTGVIALEELLIGDLLTALGDKGIGSGSSDLDQLRAIALTALEPHGEHLDAPTDAVLSRIEQWAQLILPIGSPALNLSGAYTETLTAMERFAAELLEWLIPEPVEPAEMAQRIASAARKTAALAKVRVDRVEEYRSNILDNVRNWDATWASLRADVEMISNIIDGWRRLIDKWDSVSRMDRIDQRELVELFGLYLPVLPRKAAEHNQDFWASIRENQHRWNESIGTSSLMATDQDIRDKIGSFKVEPA